MGETVKASDVWVKAAYCGEDRIGLPAYEPFDVRNVIPHSDALPAIAKWIAETPDASWLLMALDSGADAIDGNLITDRALGLKCDLNGPKNRDLLRSLASAIRAALTGGEGAGGDA